MVWGCCVKEVFYIKCRCVKHQTFCLNNILESNCQGLSQVCFEWVRTYESDLNPRCFKISFLPTFSSLFVPVLVKSETNDALWSTETQGHITIENLTLEADKDDKVRGEGIRRSVCGGQSFILQAFNGMKTSLIRIASSE